MLKHLCWRTAAAACKAADLLECGLSLMWNEVGVLKGGFQVLPDKLVLIYQDLSGLRDEILF